MSFVRLACKPWALARNVRILGAHGNHAHPRVFSDCSAGIQTRWLILIDKRSAGTEHSCRGTTAGARPKNSRNLRREVCQGKNQADDQTYNIISLSVKREGKNTMNLVMHTTQIFLLAVAFTIPLSVTADPYGHDDPFYDPETHYAGGDYYDASDPFFDLLVDYGDWIAVAEYGLVWRPHGTHVGWRPYSYGRWVATDAGWTWVSDWEWGWAPFHYGRWLNHHRIGWVWVPGDEWAPAWVDWREGDGLIGWAPLPPHVGWGPSLSLSLIFIDGDLVRPASDYHFVRYSAFLEPHVHRHILPRRRNVGLISITRNVTDYVIVNRRVVNRSVGVDRLSRALRRPIRRHRIVERSDAHVRPDRALRGDELRVFRPKLRGRGQPQRRERVEARRQRGLDADHDQRVGGSRDRFGGQGKLVSPADRRETAPRPAQRYSLPRKSRPEETATRRDSESRARSTTERRVRPRAYDGGRSDARVRRPEQARRTAPGETKPGAAAKRSGTPRTRGESAPAIDRKARAPGHSTRGQARENRRPDARNRGTEQMRPAAPPETRPRAARKRPATPLVPREPARATDRNARSPQRSTTRQERSSTRRLNRPPEQQRRGASASSPRPRATPAQPRAERSRPSAAPRPTAPARNVGRAGRESSKRSERHSSATRRPAGSPRDRRRERDE